MATRPARIFAERHHRLAWRPPQRRTQPSWSSGSSIAALAVHQPRPRTSSLVQNRTVMANLVSPQRATSPRDQPLFRAPQLTCTRCLSNATPLMGVVVPIHRNLYHKQGRKRETLVWTARRTFASVPEDVEEASYRQNTSQKREKGKRGKSSARDESVVVGHGAPAAAVPGRNEAKENTVVPKDASRVWTIPNIITMGRICFCPVLAGLIVTSNHDLALTGLAIASASDWLDGKIARDWNQKTVLGGFLDPLADKIMVTTVALALAHQGILPATLVAMIIGRDAVLITGAMAYRYKTKRAQDTFFDVGSLDYNVTPSTLSKANTALQFGTLWLGLTHAVYNIPDASLFNAVCITTGAATMASGLDYMLESGLKPKSKLGQRFMQRREIVRRRYRREEAAMRERMRIRRERRRASGRHIREEMRLSRTMLATAVRDRINRGKQRARDTEARVRGRWMRGRDTIKAMMARQKQRMQERAANRASRIGWKRGSKLP